MKLGEIVEYLRTMMYNTSAPPFIKITSLDEKQKKNGTKIIYYLDWIRLLCSDIYVCHNEKSTIRIGILHSWIGK